MGVSRRHVLLGGAGLAGAAAIPVGQHVAWGMRDFEREGYSPDYPDAPPGEDSWMNWPVPSARRRGSSSHHKPKPNSQSLCAAALTASARVVAAIPLLALCRVKGRFWTSVTLPD